MMILKNFAVVLLLACIAQQVFVANCRKDQGRKGKDGKGKPSDDKNTSPENPPAAAFGTDKGNKSRSGKEIFKGKFSTKDKTQCTWASSGDNAFTLVVNCKNGGDSFSCEYTARPAACPQYTSNAKAYWKQVARALKKQKNLCQDKNALIKAGMCKKAPKEAHFKLNIGVPPALSETTTAFSQGTKSCTEKIDHEKLAKEYCDGFWSSMCTLLFSMVQNEDC